MLITQLGILLKRFRDHAFEVNRQLRNHACRRRWFALQNSRKNHAGSVSLERLLPRRHFVKHQTERKQIRTRIQVFAAHLFGRHISYRAERGPRARQIRVRAHGYAARRYCLAHVLRHQLCQPKIEHLCLPALGDKNIRGLNVAMDDSLAVRRLERVGDVDADFEQCVELHRLAVDAMLQRHALQQFHGDERHARVPVNVVNGADAGMIQCGGRLRLALESFE